MNRILNWLTIILAILASFLSFGLLVSDTNVGIPQGLPAGALSAAPLFLIGVTFLLAQALLRPRWTDLLKNVLLAAAFILWSVVQLMEQSALARKLGDVVVALYVLDLAWVILASVKPAGMMRSGSTRADSE